MNLPHYMMKDFISSIARYLRDFLLMPTRMGWMREKVLQLEGITEAIFCYMFLQKKWPEAAEALLPTTKMPPEALADLANSYLASGGSQAMCNRFNQQLVYMAENLASLPLTGVVALFEEAVTWPASSLPWTMGRYLAFMAKYGHDDETILKVAARFEALDASIWGLGYEEVWAIYLAALVRVGEEEKALTILKQYDRKYALRKLEKVPPAAAFAKACGFSNGLIDQAATLMTLLNDGETRFKEMVAAKSLAVVGSSPLELGRGRGREIDSHDLVVRFNCVPAEPRYKADFGEKCSILSKNYAPPFTLNFPKGLSFIFLPEGVERYPVPWALTRACLKKARTQDCTLVALPLSYFRVMLRQADFVQFSTGLMTIAYLRFLKPELSPSNLYGFSHLLDPETESYSAYQQFHYYAPRSEDVTNTLRHSHPLKNEREFLLKLF